MVLESCDVQESGMLLPLSSLAIAQCTANFALSTHIRSFSVSQLVSYLSSLISLSLWVWRWWESPSWQREQRVHKSVCHLFYMESYKCNLKRSKSLTKTPRKWQKEWKLAIFILMTKYEEGIGEGRECEFLCTTPNGSFRTLSSMSAPTQTCSSMIST